MYTSINEIDDLLGSNGFERAREILQARIDAAGLSAGLDYRGIPDGRHHWRSLLAQACRAETAARHERHALFVLAGAYDWAVKSGRRTLLADGEQPAIVTAAHALRAARLVERQEGI